jgi:hypothetical protein
VVHQRHDLGVNSKPSLGANGPSRSSLYTVYDNSPSRRSRRVPGIAGRLNRYADTVGTPYCGTAMRQTNAVSAQLHHQTNGTSHGTHHQLTPITSYAMQYLSQYLGEYLVRGIGRYQEGYLALHTWRRLHPRIALPRSLCCTR